MGEPTRWQVRELDGDDPTAPDTLLPGFQAAMAQALPGDPPATAALLARLFQRRHGADRLLLAVYEERGAAAGGGSRPDSDDDSGGHGTARDGGDESGVVGVASEGRDRAAVGPPAGIVKLGLDLNDPTGPGHGSLWVFPGFRGRGAGSALVTAARQRLRARGRRELWLDAPHTAAADGFAAAFGARRTALTDRNRLPLAGPAAAGTRAALEAAARPVPGFGLRHWTGAVPDDLVDAYARAWGTLDRQVNGQARLVAPTAADVRAREAEAVRAGYRVYAVAAVADAVADHALPSGDIAAYSTLFVRDSPMADAGETLVAPRLRRRGLGSAVKAEVLLRAVQENPGLALVQVFNETTNTAIGALNRRLGFRTDSTWATYSLPA